MNRNGPKVGITLRAVADCGFHRFTIAVWFIPFLRLSSATLKAIF